MSEASKSGSISSSGVFSQSFMLRMNTEKRNKVLKHQKKNLVHWKKQEIKYLDKFLIIHSFCYQPLERCKHAQLTVEGDYDVRCFITSAWTLLPQEFDRKGLELSNLIIKPKLDLKLRSIGFIAKMRVKMIGDCDLFVVSRNLGQFEVNSPVLKVSRDTSLNGIFVMFGNLNPENGKIVFMKQVQVPEERQGANEKKFDKLDIDFCDNGDNKVFVKIEGYGKVESVKVFNTVCDTFVPFFEDSKLLIGGRGQSVRLKSLSVQQRERVVTEEPEKECKCIVV